MAGVSLVLCVAGAVWHCLVFSGPGWYFLVLDGVSLELFGICWGQSGIVGYWLESVLYCLILAGASPVL